MNITRIREAVVEQLNEFGVIEVLISPTEYGKNFGVIDEVKLNARILVGPAEDPTTESAIDDLVEDVPKKLLENRDLDGLVSIVQVLRCSGHRPYKMAEGEPAVMGTEFTLNVVGND